MRGLLDRALRSARRWLKFPPGTGELVPSEVRPKLALSVAASFLMSLLDLAGVLTLVPLMQYVSGAPRDQGALGMVSSLLGQPSDQGLIIALGATIVATFVLKDLVAIALRWWQMRFMASYAARISTGMMRDLLTGPYHRHLAHNSADKAWIADGGVQIAYGNGIGGGLALVTQVLSISLILVGLLVVSPVGTLLTIAYFGLGGWLLFRALRSHSRAVGERLLDASRTTNRVLMEAMGAAKEIKLRRAHDRFLSDYQDARFITAESSARQQVIAELPKYLLEILMIVGISMMAIFVTATTTPDRRLVVLGVLVAGSTKIAPAVVGLLNALNSIQFAHEAMRVLIAERRETQLLRVEEGDVVTTGEDPTGDIAVKGVSFAYRSAPETPVIDALNLRIKSGQSVALVGGSGAGKSTLVDLLLGLHRPQEGVITVGGINIWNNLAAWQRQLAVVPQEVYLLDDTLRNNITFDMACDEERLNRVIEQAQLRDLVDDLESGVDSRVGQRGMRLSGGQRQRIGIARALYRDPAVLVLDEATSALDNETERRLSDTIRGLRGTMTMIIVAHRLSTVKDCDLIAYLDRGRVAAIGSFAEVVEQNVDFANLVRLGSLSEHP